MKIVSEFDHSASHKVFEDGKAVIKTFKFIPGVPTEVNDEYAQNLVNTFPERYSIVTEDVIEDEPVKTDAPDTLDEKELIAQIPTEEALNDETLFPTENLKTFAKELGIKGWANSKRETLIANILALKNA